MMVLERRAASAALSSALLLVPVAAEATKIKTVSGLSGAQDSRSRDMLTSSPEAGDRMGRRDLLSILQSPGKLMLDNSRNVEGMAFVTQPYWTGYRYVCREDRVTLRYQLQDRFDGAGAWLSDERQPVGVEAQPIYHIAQLPVPGFAPDGTSHPVTECDARQPGAGAAWFAAPSDMEAVRAANMFRMAEDEVKAGRLTPGPCDPYEMGTCRQWFLSLDDPSKIQSVESCAPGTGDDACYVISFDSVDVTITGTIPRKAWEPITPSAITSIRVDTVLTFSI